MELGMLFYNALLPGVAPPNRIGRVSGWGWASGYVGGLICLGAALVLLVQPEHPVFGIPKDEITVTPLGVDVEWQYGTGTAKFIETVRLSRRASSQPIACQRGRSLLKSRAGHFERSRAARDGQPTPRSSGRAVGDRRSQGITTIFLPGEETCACHARAASSSE